MGGGERGREGGGVDLNLGIPDPVRSAIRSDNPPETAAREVSAAAEEEGGEARRSEKEVVINGWVEKVKVGL